jgi:hypothetical protein
VGTLCIGALFATYEDALAQVCRPVAGRTSELGCWIIAAEPIGNLSKPQTFWHLDTYLTPAAAEVAKNHLSGEQDPRRKAKTSSRSRVLAFRVRTTPCEVLSDGTRSAGARQSAESASTWPPLLRAQEILA